MRVLLIDIGGSSVKLMVEEDGEVRAFDTGDEFTPEQLVAAVREHAKGWEYDAAAIGYPGLVVHGRPSREPGNLGSGWVGFDLEAALGVPVRMMNDAALQALASYDDGRMLFLGFGTGLGSTLIVDHVVVPLELGEMRYDKEHTLSELLGKKGRKKIGRERWQTVVQEAIAMFQKALWPDEIVLGGGQAEKIDPLPRGTRRGENRDAYRGALRLWSHVGERTEADESSWTIL